MLLKILFKMVLINTVRLLNIWHRPVTLAQFPLLSAVLIEQWPSLLNLAPTVIFEVTCAVSAALMVVGKVTFIVPKRSRRAVRPCVAVLLIFPFPKLRQDRLHAESKVAVVLTRGLLNTAALTVGINPLSLPNILVVTFRSFVLGPIQSWVLRNRPLTALHALPSAPLVLGNTL